MTAHLPAIQVVVPLLAAALCVLVPWRRVSWGIAFAGAVTAFVAAVGLLSRVMEGEDIRYAGELDCEPIVPRAGVDKAGRVVVRR